MKLMTRAYNSAKSAEAVRDRLRFMGIPNYQTQVISKGNMSASAVAKRLKSARVPADAAGVLADHVKDGASVLVVSPTYKPLGAARIAREVLDGSDAIKTKLKSQDFEVEKVKDHAPSVIKDHPTFFTPRPDEDWFVPRPMTSSFGMPLLAEKKSKRSAISGGRYMSRAFWPMKLISTKARGNKTMDGSRRMSRMFWPMPLLSSKPRRKSVFRPGEGSLSRKLGWKTVMTR